MGEDDDETQKCIAIFSGRVMNVFASTVFCHPKAALNEGRKLRRSKVDQTNIVALMVDEAYCVYEWYVIVLFHV